MKVLIYWHDIYLPYSDYLIRGFAANPDISQLCIVGPSEYEADAIYSGSKNTQAFPEKVIFKKIQTYFFRKNWGPISEFKKCIQEFKPECIIVVDEAFSVNVLNAAIANALLKNKATVLFYGFENIKQIPPFRFLVENFSLKNTWLFIRKTIRYLIGDALLQPIRTRVVSGGLVCYQECADVVHQFGWRPLTSQQWWGLDLQPFFKAARLGPRVKSDTKTIGYVGRLIEAKGVLDLMELMRQLGPNYQLLIIGSGPLEDQLKKMSSDLTLASRVSFLPPQSREELASLYAKLDVLILPSRTDYFWKEQYGRVLVEAMATATPVVGSRSGAIPYVIEKATCLFDEGHLDQMKRAIEQACSMDETACQQLQARSLLGGIDQFVTAFLELHSRAITEKSR